MTEDQLLQLSERIEPEDLPGDLPEVAEITGIYKALLIADRLGGGAVYLRRWSDDRSQWSDEMRRWVDLIGEESTEDVARMFHGNYINIPSCTALFTRHRNELIRDRRNEPAIDLAREFGRSTRQIKRIRNNQDDDRQESLFEL